MAQNLTVCLTLALGLCTATQAQSVGTVAPLNGNYSQTVSDLSVQASVGEVSWMRVFNGSGWRFNRHWDGINASFKPALTQSTGGGMFTSAGTQGSGDTALCWIWVDEDYNPGENRRIAPLIAPTVAAPVGIPASAYIPANAAYNQTSHPFKTDEGWRDAILLKKGGKLLLKGGDADSAQPRYATIADVRIEEKTTPVFNLEVVQLHTFLVGVDGVVVHNAKSGTSGNNSHARGGKDYHNEPYPAGYKREQNLPGGGRADAVDYENKVIRERKYTDRKQTVNNAINQVLGYCKKKPGFRGEVEIRSPSTGETTIFSVFR